MERGQQQKERKREREPQIALDTQPTNNKGTHTHPHTHSHTHSHITVTICTVGFSCVCWTSLLIMATMPIVGSRAYCTCCSRAPPGSFARLDRRLLRSSGFSCRCDCCCCCCGAVKDSCRSRNPFKPFPICSICAIFARALIVWKNQHTRKCIWHLAATAAATAGKS